MKKIQMENFQKCCFVGGWRGFVEVGGDWWRLVEIGGNWWRLVELLLL
jgi:hypothetical protein